MDSKIPASKQVNLIGRYLYQHIDSAYKFEKTSNMFDIYVMILYTDAQDYSADIHEMKININITTYQNKIRIDTIDWDMNERTLGFDLFTPETLQDLEIAKKLILNKVIRRVKNAYKQYDFIFDSLY